MNPAGEYSKKIANFWPNVEGLVEQCNGNTKSKFANLNITLTDVEDCISETVPIKDLDKLDWKNDVDYRCFINPDVPKAKEHIASLIHLNCYGKEPTKTTVIDRLGTHVIAGVACFNAGSMLIWPDGLEDKPDVKWSPIPNTRLAIDSDCSECEADYGMTRIVDLSHEVGRIDLAFNILNVTREAFTCAGITPRVSLFKYGFTGVKKTTSSAFVSQIYNRDKPLESPTRLNASVPAAVKLLYEKADCAVILDDLFASQASDIRRQQEKTLLEITRVIGDGIEPARMRGEKVAKAPPRCGAFFTGEMLIGSGSDAARLVPVKMTVPIDNEKLTACQQEPLILSTFYYFFIKWYITEFYKLVKLIEEWKTVYRRTKTGIHDRLQEAQFCLEAAYRLYLTYRIDRGFITKDTGKEEYNIYYQQLRAIIKEQNLRTNQSRGVNLDINYLALIRSMYQDKQLKLVSGVNDFEVKEHDGIIYKGYLYLRRDKLMKKIHLYEASADFDDVLKNLKDQKALKLGGKGCNSRKITGKCRLRFYTIPLAKLQ
jgi:hypothetical protein